MKIVMVCLGNICRSPMAEGVMRDALKKHKLNAVVDSAGTQGYHSGEKPDHRAIHCAGQHGIDISALRARKFVPEDFDEFDLILTMDNNNLKDVLKLAKTEHHRKKVAPFLSVLPDGLAKNVPDPYYGGPKDFELVYNLCAEASEAWCKRLQRG